MDKFMSKLIDLTGYLFCLGLLTLMQGVGFFLAHGLSPLTGLPI